MFKRTALAILIAFLTISCGVTYKNSDMGRYHCYGTVDDGFTCVDTWDEKIQDDKNTKD